MAKYIVEIEETLSKQIKVNANSPEQAKEMVIKEYKNGNIILTADNFFMVNFWCNLPDNDGLNVGGLFEGE